MILVLLAATAVMLALGHVGDALAIVASVVFSVVFGFITDYRAERALEALRALSAPDRARRAGKPRAGDPCGRPPARRSSCSLTPGQIVAADGRIAAVRDLQIDESALTGESVPVTKAPDPIAAAAPLPDRTSAWPTPARPS